MRRKAAKQKTKPLRRASAKPNNRQLAAKAASNLPWRVLIRSFKNGRPIGTNTISGSPRFEKLAQEWAYDLRNRRYWANSNEAKRGRSVKAREALKEHLGLDSGGLVKLAEATEIEVQFTDAAGADSTSAHSVPWEYLLSAATREERKGPLLVTRRLGTTHGAPKGSPSRLLFIESAPGNLAGKFDFSSERDLVRRGLSFPDKAVTISVTQPADAIVRDIGQSQDVIHFAGFDTLQGARLAPKSAKIEAKPGGILVRGTGSSIDVIDSMEIARAFKNYKLHPHLVVFNCYNSAAKLVGDAVRGGACAAVGFQDYIDDDIAEMFLAQLHREWRQTDWNIHQAFRNTWASIRSNKLHGTGIVLLTSYSHVAGSQRRSLIAEDKVPVSQQIVPVVQEREEVNYSLLHNNQPLFRKFSINRIAGSQPIEVGVLVELNVGSETYPFRYAKIIGAVSEQLVDDIKIPLTSEFARSLRDRVNSTIYVKITAKEREREVVLFSKTLRVTLLPVDEWSDDSTSKDVHDSSDRRAVWLPSFVLPRDPTIRKIVDNAQKYLVALSDNPGAGFDGYQQTADNDEAVDDQVQAIWYSIVNDSRLSYINPPPSYGAKTQRLRTPSDIVEGRRGTCIDLALLFAACLEYVEIYPAIVLLRGHAFPAYWRSDTSHDEFVEKFSKEVTGAAASFAEGPAAKTILESSSVSWAFENDRQKFRGIMKCIQRNELVPIETVWLTNQSSFASAVEAGLENMGQPAEFEYLLDVMQARRHTPFNVTPLPVVKFGD